MELPTGTVTLLFSDVEGSTSLLSRLGPVYADALDGLRSVQRAAWIAHGGVELGTEGDSFFVVFETAEAAVLAAVRAQRDLEAFPWPDGEGVRVRMGLHTGSPTRHDDAYVGMDVHRAARIAAAAHGGQVLVSSVTAQLVAECLPDGVTLRELGSHRLKDISAPERLLQVSITGLRERFPPPRSLGASSSLPRPPTPLVGRDGELAELGAVLRHLEVRLVTLTGPGGSGKTRLAVGVAEQLVEVFVDGVYFVPLATVTTADQVWPAIGEVLDLAPEEWSRGPLLAHLAHRRALLVLDNLEQVDSVDTVVATIVDRCPAVALLATSRRPVLVKGEHLHPVPPLELPAGTDYAQVAASGAVRMFVDIARATRPSFALDFGNAAAIAELCRRLDGLPLALELAAARIRLLSPSAVLARIDRALDLTSRDTTGEARQKTLRDTIAWSYDLLEEPQKALFRRMGVFSGGADLDAIAAVAAEVIADADPLDLLADLVDASLVDAREDDAGEPRFTMLETIKQYAAEQLQLAGEIERVSQLHATYYARLIEPLTFTVREAAQYHRSIRRFRTEIDNVRSALGWAFRSPLHAPFDGTGVEVGLDLADSFGVMALYTLDLDEAQRWLDLALETVAECEPTPPATRCLLRLSEVLSLREDTEGAASALHRALVAARKSGDTRNLWVALRNLGPVELARGDLTAARRAFAEATDLITHLLQQPSGEIPRDRLQRGLSYILASQGEAALDADDLDVASRFLHESYELDLALGDEVAIAENTYTLAALLWRQGKRQEALSRLRESLDAAVILSDPLYGCQVAERAAFMLSESDPEDAAMLLGAVRATRERYDLSDAVTGLRAEERAETEKRITLLLTDRREHEERGRSLSWESALTLARESLTGEPLA